MSMQYVQFADSNETTIVSWFASPQDPEVYACLGQVEDGDERYVAYLTPLTVEIITDPLEKLKAFLLANPDVAAILS